MVVMDIKMNHQNKNLKVLFSLLINNQIYTKYTEAKKADQKTIKTVDCGTFTK